MEFKKFTAIFFVAILLVVQLPTVYAETPAGITIEITRNGEEVEFLEIDDIIRVEISFRDFANVRMLNPSLHFNSRVVQVIHPVTMDDFPDWLMTNNRSFFRVGTAIGGEPGPNNWGGTVPIIGEFPFLNNRTGLIGMWFDSFDGGIVPQDLNGTQSVYWVYMRIIGAGNTNIRMSSSADGVNPSAGSAETWVYDPNVYSSTGLQYSAPYVPFEIAPYIAPVVIQPIVSAEVFRYSDGMRITNTNLSALQGGNQIYATFDRTDLPESARLILAIYDGERFHTADISGDNATRNITIPNGMENITIKVFVWESLGTMNQMFRPLILKTNA